MPGPLGARALLGAGVGDRPAGSHALALSQVEYFNNATIVDLVERPHRGILAVLDEACSTAGTITDQIFLQTLDKHHCHHPHYTSRQVTPGPLGSAPLPCPQLVLARAHAPRVPHCLSRWDLSGGLASSAGLSPLPPQTLHSCALTLACPLSASSSPPQTRPWSLAETSGSSTMQGMSRKAPPPLVLPSAPPFRRPRKHALHLGPVPRVVLSCGHITEPSGELEKPAHAGPHPKCRHVGPLLCA